LKREKHEVLARVLTEYWSLVVRAVSTLIILVIIGYVIYMLWTDVDAKTRTKQEEILFEIEKCSSNHKANKCDNRVAEIEEYCIEKEKCMNRDPYRETSKTVQASKLFAESINNFFESMSLKTICCLFTFIFFPLCAILCCFRSLRR
jgi:uncharacterized membrane protein YraQ (UPF0718 family)